MFADSTRKPARALLGEERVKNAPEPGDDVSKGALSSVNLKQAAQQCSG